MIRRTISVLIVAALYGCAPDPEESGVTEGVTGAYSGTVGATSPLADGDSAATTASLHVTVDESGFAHGLWILWGDTLVPSDPWEAVVTGVYMGPRMVVEYSHPTKGLCQLNGPVSEAEKYEPVRRCADAWEEPDTLDLTFFPMWRGLVVRPAFTPRDHPDGKYVNSDFGSVPARLEDTIIAQLPQKGDSVYTPYSCMLKPLDGSDTDIEHIVAKKEAHYSGRLTKPQRREFGRDLVNLTIADPGVNRNEKGDNDTWQPDRNRGWMAERIIRAKQKWHLSVDDAERTVLEHMLKADPSKEVTCP